MSSFISPRIPRDNRLMSVLVASIIALAVAFLLRLLDVPDMPSWYFLLMGAVAFYLTLEAFRV